MDVVEVNAWLLSGETGSWLDRMFVSMRRFF